MIGPPEICPHCGKSHKPIVQAIKPPAPGKLAPGTRVRNMALWSQRCGAIGTVVGPVPWTFEEYGVDVRYDADGRVLPVAEVYLQEVKESGDDEIEK